MIIQHRFPCIYHIQDLMPKIEGKKEIKVKQQPNGFYVVCYMIADNTTFDSPEALECRGITFYPSGNIAARPLHKFFNLDEKESTFSDNLPPLSQASRVAYKEDGSLIHPVLLPSSYSGWQKEVLFKSKKSFDSDVVFDLEYHLDRKFGAGFKQKLTRFCHALLTSGYTPSFEWVAPSYTSRIVVTYDKPQLKLLHIRNTITGSYLPLDLIITEAKGFGMEELVEPTKDLEQTVRGMTWADLKNWLVYQENMEGVVVQFANGEMVKVKTPWYLRMHRLRFLSRARDIAESVLDGTIDDYKTMWHDLDLDLGPVEEIEYDVVQKLNKLQESVESICNDYHHLDRKSFAIRFKEREDFSLLIKAYEGREPDYIGYFRKKYLPDYSLELVI